MSIPSVGSHGAPMKLGGVDSHYPIGSVFYEYVEVSGVLYRRKCAYLYCTTTTLSIGDLVGLDRADTTYGFGLSVKESPAVLASTYEYVGVAAEALSAAGPLKVALEGYALVNTEADSSITAGTRMIVNVAAAGEAIKQATAAAADVMIGVALAAETTGTPDTTPCLLKDQGWIS